MESKTLESGNGEEESTGLKKGFEKLSLTDDQKVMYSPESPVFFGGPSEPIKNFKGHPSLHPIQDNESAQLSRTGNGIALPSSPIGNSYSAKHFAGSGMDATPPNPVVSNTAHKKKEKDISILDENDISKLAMHLDPDHGSTIKNWYDLAYKFNIPSHEREDMRRSYHGGGNPALTFLKKLKNDSNAGDVKGLIEKCRTIQRNDCVIYLQRNVSDLNTKIQDLSDEHLARLASKLVEKSIVINCWKNIASLYGYKRDHIMHISSTIKEHNQYSPTVLLFQKLSSAYPEMPIEQLIQNLKAIERYDIVNTVEKMVRDKHDHHAVPSSSSSVCHRV